jgi:hypothetical protein
MKDDSILMNKGFLFLTFFIIGLVTFFPLFFTGFATADDLHFYLTAHRGQISAETSLFARTAGRFYFYLVKPVYNLPYLFGDNMLIVKVFQYVPLILCFLLFAKIVVMITKSKEMAWLFLLLFLMTMQISRHTSLFVAYPFYFTFSFFLLLSSYYFLLRFLEEHKTSFLIVSAVLFGAGLLFYETYILYLLFAIITILSFNIKGKNSILRIARNSLLPFMPFLIIGIIYLSVYFIFRIYYPSQYGGTSFATKGISISSFFHVLWGLAYSSFPLTVYETSKNVFWDRSDMITGYSPVILNLILSARVEWLVKGLMVVFCGYKLLHNLPGLKLKSMLAISAMALLMIFLPHVPLALSEKYTFYVEKASMLGYVTTFFSFFGTLLLLTILISYLINLFNFNRRVKIIIASVMVAGFFICSVLSDFSNYYIARDIRSANLRFRAMDELVKTNEFDTIPNQTPFYGRTLWDNPSASAGSLTEQEFNWYEYFEAKTGKIYTVCREDKIFLDYARRVPQVPYYLAARQAEKSEEILVVMARMTPLQPQDSLVNPHVDKALVLYYSPCKIFTVSFRVKGDPAITAIPIQVNHIRDTIAAERTVEVNIYTMKKGDAATIFTIRSHGIDLTSIQVSDMINPRNKWFYL